MEMAALARQLHLGGFESKVNRSVGNDWKTQFNLAWQASAYEGHTFLVFESSRRWTQIRAGNYYYVWPVRLLSVVGTNRQVFHCPASAANAAWDTNRRTANGPPIAIVGRPT